MSMDKRFFVLALCAATGHFILSTIFFLFFGIGLENRSFGSKLFWWLQEPAAFLTVNGLIPDFKLLAFPLNSLLWGCGVAVILRFFQSK